MSGQQTYSATIIDTNLELTKIQRIAYVNAEDCIRLDTTTNDNPIVINPKGFLTVAIHNDKSESKDYTHYIIVDHDGSRFVTGSQNFMNSFTDIFYALEGEDYQIKVITKPSKNYTGKGYLSCVVVV